MGPSCLETAPRVPGTADGETQPVGQVWNRGGFANNATHDITVVCTP